MAEFIFVRHGEAVHLVEDLTGGWTDTALTERGMDQALKTGVRLKSMIVDPIDTFFCSDLIRTKQTAEIIMGSLGITPHIASELRDINNGVAANRKRSEARSIRNPITHPVLDWVPYPQAESWRKFQGRIERFLRRLPLEDHHYIIVTHAQVIVAAVYWWLGMSPSQMEKVTFDIMPCSITWLNDSRRGGHNVKRINDTSHLGC